MFQKYDYALFFMFPDRYNNRFLQLYFQSLSLKKAPE